MSISSPRLRGSDLSLAVAGISKSHLEDRATDVIESTFAAFANDAVALNQLVQNDVILSSIVQEVDKELDPDAKTNSRSNDVCCFICCSPRAALAFGSRAVLNVQVFSLEFNT